MKKMSDKTPNFPSKPMLPYFQITSPRNSTLNTPPNTSTGPEIERISTMFRHHTLDIVPTYDPENTVNILKKCRTRHSRKHNEAGVHKKIHKRNDSDFLYSNVIDNVENENLKLKMSYPKECYTCEEFKKINEECLCELEQLRKDNQILKAAVKQSCQNCTNFENKLQFLKVENERLSNLNKNLNEDLSMLKNVVFRLNVQLERYQDKLRKNYKQNLDNPDFIQQASGDLDEDKQIPTSWGKVNTHTLAPLLDAYQDAIIEKEDLIKNYQKELDNCSGKLKDVLQENESLHKKILDNEERNAKLGVSQEEVNREIYLLREKNDTLGKKCVSLNEKVQDLLKMYEQKVESMSKEYEQLRQEYQTTKSEFCTLQGKHQTIIESMNIQKRENENFVPLALHHSSLAEARRAYDGLKAEYDTEKIKMHHQIKSLEKQKLEFEKEVIALRTERNELQFNYKALDKVVNKLKINNDQQQHQIVSLQISRDSCRRQLQKSFTFSRELVREQEQLLSQLAEKNRDTSSLQQLHTAGSEMSNKMESIKSQFQTLQQEAMQSLDSVEQKMQQQDSHICTIKKTYDSEVAVLNQMLVEKDELIQKLSTEAREKMLSKPAYLLYKDLHKK